MWTKPYWGPIYWPYLHHQDLLFVLWGRMAESPGLEQLVFSWPNLGTWYWSACKILQENIHLFISTVYTSQFELFYVLVCHWMSFKTVNLVCNHFNSLSILYVSKSLQIVKLPWLYETDIYRYVYWATITDGKN